MPLCTVQYERVGTIGTITTKLGTIGPGPPQPFFTLKYSPTASIGLLEAVNLYLFPPPQNYCK